MTECISNLNLSNGAMLTVSSSSSGSIASGPKTMKAKSSQRSVDNKWEPFPELSQRQKTSSRRCSSSRIATFGYYSSDSMHVVEAQPKGPIQRIYMCQFSASQFQLHLQPSSSSKKKTASRYNNKNNNRIAWLFGTVQEERVHKN